MSTYKQHEDILQKLKITQLNPMQEEAAEAISANKDVILLSPTGTGKTLAFLLPVLEKIDINIQLVQVVIVVPSRELALQIEQVVREMGTGHKVNAVYGGRAGAKDKIDLKHAPSILIATPGRLSDHLTRRNFDSTKVHTLILDEFDKSLEIGFEEEMKAIILDLNKVKQKILTSATQGVRIPKYVNLRNPHMIDYLEEGTPKLVIKRIISPDKDKLETLLEALGELCDHPEPQNGLIFCNYKESIERISLFLAEKKVSHGCYHGSMEQIDRERALIKFRNGTHQLLIATDLAARGLDIPELKFIIHYQLPHREEEFTHRNGRTARMNKDGSAYLLVWENEPLPDFIPELPVLNLKSTKSPKPSQWETLFVSGGRKDKISKGDIAGYFMKQGGLTQDTLGLIEIKTDCAFVAVAKSKAHDIIAQLDNTRIKTKKVRITKI